MRRKHTVIALTFIAALGLHQGALGETLEEALEAAYLNNPTLQAQRASLRAAAESINQAKAGWRPSIAASGQYGYRNSQTEQTFSTSGDTTPRNLSIEARQPIFSGLQTVHGTSEARHQVDAAREQLESVEQQILLDTVTAYMGVLRDTAVLELTKNNVNVLRRQLEASEDRFRVGEITRTDVAQSKARLSRSISEKVRAEAALTASRAAYGKVVGFAPGSLVTPAHLPAMPASKEASLEIAKVNNPVLAAAQYTERAARYNVKKQYGGLLPRIDVVARYSKSWENFSKVDQSTTKEFMAEMTVPLYQSGAVSSHIRQSRQIENQRRMEVFAAERNVVEQVRNSWESYLEATSRITSTEDQVEANEIALEGVRQEAEVGSRTVLNVLDAEQELLDSQVSLVEARRDQYVAAYTLLSAIGRLNAADLQLNVQKYDPAAYRDKVDGKFYGWGIDEE